MASSPSFSISSFSTNSYSPVSPPRAEECRPSDSSGNESGPPSSSSGIITQADAKALQALEAMKSFHDFNSIVTFKSLASIWKRYSIPDEYILHAPGLGQRPYHSNPGGFNISIDALEAGLRFPFPRSLESGQGGYYLTSKVGFRVDNTPSNNKGWKARFLFVSRYRGWGFGVEWSAHLFRYIIFQLMVDFTEMVSMSLMRDNPKVGGGHSGIVSSALAPTPTPSPRAESGSTSEVQEIPVEEATRRPSREEARGAPKVPYKRQAKDPTVDRKKDQCKSHHEADRSATKGKGPVDTAEEPPAPRRKPKSMRELCSATSRVDGRDYHAIRMCSLPKHAPDTPLDIDLMPLTHRMWVWPDGEASTRYI
ncbi:hypothetical protein B296_00023689 [Ensete ventricosum]|uniref:Uncharacterized protein n=1 Tax=Ensete ventricosum TaxID=4639 RepID=A0A427AC72_ENSVE|nr:hypothetical protein B296_00023689 [Ensete ventricosum]